MIVFQPPILNPPPILTHLGTPRIKCMTIVPVMCLMLIIESYGAPVKRGASLDMGTILLGGVDEVAEMNFDPLTDTGSTLSYYLQALTYKSPSWAYEKVKRRSWNHPAGFTETPSYGITSYSQLEESGGIERADGDPIDGVPSGEPDSFQPGGTETIGGELGDNDPSRTTPGSGDGGVPTTTTPGSGDGGVPSSVLGNTSAETGMISNDTSSMKPGGNTSSTGFWNSVVGAGKGLISNATSSVLNQGQIIAEELIKSLIPKNLKLYIGLFIAFIITFTCCCICGICICFWKLLREIRKVPEKTQRRLEGKDCYDDTCR